MNDHTLQTMQCQPKPARPQSDELIRLAWALLMVFVLILAFLVFVEIDLRRMAAADKPLTETVLIKGE